MRPRFDYYYYCYCYYYLYSYINLTGGITSLFRLHVNAVEDCTPVSLNCALVRLIITPVSLDITQVSLNNVPVTLFTVRSQRWKYSSNFIQLQKVYALCSLHFTLSLHLMQQSADQKVKISLHNAIMRTDFYHLVCTLLTK